MKEDMKENLIVGLVLTVLAIVGLWSLLNAPVAFLVAAFVVLIAGGSK